MTGEKYHQDQLTDSEYIEWLGEQEWSLTQAVYLLHGFNPPESNKNEKQLQRQFPDAENLLQNHKEWAKRVKNLEKLNRQFPDDESQIQRMRRLKEEYPCYPGSWVNRAFSNGMNFKYSWIAIFPKWMPDQLSYVTEEEPDYHRLIQVFTRDTETRLRELVGFALNLNEYRKDNPTAEYYELLEDVNSKLQPKAKDIDYLPNRLVSPQRFFEICSSLDIVLDSRCLELVEWKMRHPELAAMLKDPSIAKKMRSRTKNGNKSLPEMGGNARAAKYEKLRLHAIALYKKGSFHSTRAASLRLVGPVNQFAKGNKDLIPLTENNAQDTIYKWLLEHDNQSK